MNAQSNHYSDFSVELNTHPLKKIFAYVKASMSKAKTRKQLSELPDHLLSDIGVSRYEADKESSKPFWK
ncbi:DUF1127 domain-containing protein [Vibrio makurazakiensis]|uniref:DUF1127 domain-containing protein n=1 Tax=Vibrio makurazakiensis TaxID=2910250 RepID=UPI003D09C147